MIAEEFFRKATISKLIKVGIFSNFFSLKEAGLRKPLLFFESEWKLYIKFSI